MAKINGLVGGMSGKFGNAVFRQSGGKTIAAQYQPIVANPNTRAQQNQRAKFKLLSQLGAIFAPHLGGFNTTSRGNRGMTTQRNEFFRANYQTVTVDDSEPDTVTADIRLEEVKLTSSFRTLASSLNVLVSAVGVDITLLEAANDVDTVHAVVLETHGTIGVNERPARIIQAGNYPVVEGRVKIDSDMTADKSYTVLLYGVIPLSSATRARYENIYTPAATISAAVTLERDIQDGNVAVTETMGWSDLFVGV